MLSLNFQPQQTILTLFKPLQRGIATCMTCQNTKVFAVRFVIFVVDKIFSSILCGSFHCERPYRSDANILSYLPVKWNNRKDLYQKWMNTTALISSLYQKLIQLNAPSIVSLIDASSIKFAIIKYMEFNNVINFYIYLIVIFLIAYCEIIRLLLLRHIGRLHN